MPTNLTTKIIPPKYAFLQQLSVGLDIIIVVVWVVAALVYAMGVARKKGPVLLLSTYAGLAVLFVVSKLNFDVSKSLVDLQKGDFFHLLVFAVVFLISFVSLVRVITRPVRIHASRNGLIMLAALEMGAFLASLGSLLPADLQKQITGFAGIMFLTPWMHTLWLIVPLLIILIGEHNNRAVLDRV